VARQVRALWAIRLFLELELFGVYPCRILSLGTVRAAQGKP